MTNKQTFIDKCYKDKSGKVVIVQSPNIPIIGWLICKLLGYMSFSERILTGVAFVGTALLFTWAYLELTSGVNYLRRLLGFAILLMLIIAHS